jgi:DNA-binding CsgD family transcriptional regulator
MELAAAVLVQDRLNPVAASPGGQVLLNTEEWARLTSAVRLNLRQGRTPGIFCVPRQPGNTAWLVCLTPMLDPVTGSNGSNLLLVFDLDEKPAFELPALRAAFRLTKAEARLVEQLLQGRTPVEAAEALGVTIHTVRTYLKRLYVKLGVKSQAMLVRKLLQTAFLSASERSVA